jgi:hypothetical protein
MLFKNQVFPRYARTAGKITVITSITGLLIFMMAFLFDVGTKEVSRVLAQTASTTLTVLNTPPSFTLNAYEVIESSTSTPTNSGDQIQWSAIGNDTNAAPYFLLICSTNASPTANAASGPGNLGTAAPTCGGGVQWGVSAGTPSDSVATVSTTTTEVAPFDETNNWFAWVCDDDPFNPRCNNIPVQGYSATNSSPFHVNKRPVFTDFDNNGPVNPGDILTFLSTSSDPDLVGGEDNIKLVVCNSNTDYNSTTNTCTNDFIASTTINVLADASATYTLPSIIRDDTYPAYGYIVDQHGHEALANPVNVDFDVNNVAPTVLGGDIEIYGEGGVGTDLSLSVPGSETPSSTINFTIRDANSCLNAASSSEIVDFSVVVFRSSYGTTTCDGTGANYNPNNCYDNGVPTTTWNISCQATTTCASPLQDYMDYTCDFPLWFVADPTVVSAKTPVSFSNDNWSAAVAGIDDDTVSGPLATTSTAVELLSFSSLDLLTDEIAYGAIEPGYDTGTLSASSTIINVGNTGLDQEAAGESMCGTYTVSNECLVSATSTIPESEQKFSSTSLSYASGLAMILSSTTPNEVELNVHKTTSTTTPQQGTTYWGIAVPVSITLAGSYQGLNTFTAVMAEAVDW